MQTFLTDWLYELLSLRKSPFKKQDWISVDEELPDADIEVIAYTKNGYHYLTSFNGEHFYEDDEVAINVTHWQHLTTPAL